MSHYDSECEHCHEFGMFRALDCGCAAARAERTKVAADAQARLKKAEAILRNLGCPYQPFISDAQSHRANDLVALAEWAERLAAR
jgi:hypothetical protein